MLQDSGVPARSTDRLQFEVWVETLDHQFSEARHQSGESCETEAAFKEIDSSLAGSDNAWIDDYVKRKWLAFSSGEFLFGQVGRIFRQVFDNGVLNGDVDLRSSQSHTGCVTQTLVHRGNEIPNGIGGDLFVRERPRTPFRKTGSPT